MDTPDGRTPEEWYRLAVAAEAKLRAVLASVPGVVYRMRIRPEPLAVVQSS